jgi:NitT/TauT family transport system ATP-binding protein
MAPASQPVQPGAFVVVDKVTKVYPARSGAVLALDEVSLHVEEGEFVSILGSSGCGKSTLLMLMSGLLPVSSGSIQILGKQVRGPYIDLGIVFQQDVLLDWRNVLDNVLLQADVRHLDKAEATKRARYLLNLVGLQGFEDKYPSQLSGGMRQRVSICRALLHDAPLLLMDEPFGALDALTREQMNLELLRIWQRQRKTVVFVTHSIPEAVFLSDRVIVMTPRPGRIEEVIKVDLPRPRTMSMRDDARFADYNRHIRRIFQASGILSEE